MNNRYGKVLKNALKSVPVLGVVRNLKISSSIF